MIDLSISIVSLDVKEYLRRCLESIFRHPPHAEIEVFVVDNASSDGTADRIETEFPKVRLIRNKENLGFAKGHNQALAKSSGCTFMILNPDTEVKEGTLEIMLSFMESHPDVGLLGPRMLNRDGSLQPSCHKRFPNLLDLTLEAFGIGPLILWLYKEALFKKIFVERVYARHRQKGEIAWAGGACLLARRSAIDRVGGLDEHYFIYREDTDWCFEFRRRGWKVYFLPQAEIIHDWGKTTGQWETLSIVSAARSNLHFFSKHAPRGLRWMVPCLCGIGLVLRLFWSGVGYILLRSRRKALGERMRGYQMALLAIVKAIPERTGGAILDKT